jgi:6-phosphogluconolactonase (cycloisomerase 2 family)
MKHPTRRSLIVAVAALPLAGCGASSPPTAAAASPPFVYVANSKHDEISQYSTSSSDLGALAPLAPAMVPAGSFPYGIAIDPQGTSVYAADVNGNEVSQYTINPITGRLTPKSPATVAAGRGSVEVAVTPNGKSAYVVDHNAVSQYSINPTTGNLIPKSPATVAAGRQSEAIAISPNDKYVYVANCPHCTVKPKGSHPGSAPNPATAGSTIWEYRINQTTGTLSRVGTAATGNGANGIAITPNGKSLYVAVSAVWQYTINLNTGKLTPKSPANVPAPGSAHEIVTAPDGKSAYVVTVANNTISQYRINPRTGALSTKPASTAHTVPAPEAIKLAPDGNSAYVTSEHEGQLSQYNINPTTGKITPKSPATVPTGSGSLGLATTPRTLGTTSELTASSRRSLPRIRSRGGYRLTHGVRISSPARV